MKKLVFILLTGISLVSCSKKDVSSPGAANQSIFYQDANVSVENLYAVQTDPGVITVSFSTLYEKDVKRIEVMTSADANTFCTSEGINTAGNSSSVKEYSFKDTNIKGSTMYFMLRFENNLGEWSYSPYYTAVIN
jgi:hypothetical protein